MLISQKGNYVMELRRFLSILAMSLIVLLGITMWFFPPDVDFRIDNPFWNGSEDISSSISISALKSTSELPLSPTGSTLIAIPYHKFNHVELEETHRFVIRGGTLVLADDYGFGNEVLEYFGLRARFSGQALLDPMSNYKNKWFPRISRLAPSALTSNVESLILNHASSLDNVESSEVLASSSVFSFLDLDGDELRDEGEPTGPLPVISQHSLGSGKVILIADPSLFINSMDKLGSNHTLVQNIAAVTTSELFIDQSHLPSSSLLEVKKVLAVSKSWLAAPAGAISLVMALLAITLMPLWYKKRK